MSTAKARVLIAKDVLQRLRYRKVQSGTYLSDMGLRASNILDDQENKYYEKNKIDIDDDSVELPDELIDARKHIVKFEKECPACALGNMLLSHIRLFDNVGLNELSYDDGRDLITDKLKDYFDSDQLDLIENAFESGGHYSFTDFLHRPKAAKAELYNRKYPEAKKRLRVIMLNIIKNKGTFVPEDFRTKEEKAEENTYKTGVVY